MNKGNLYIIVGFFVVVISLTLIFHVCFLNDDYDKNVNFIVAKRDVRINGYCTLYDKDQNKMPIQSHTFYKSEIYIGDSIVKAKKSMFLFVYRKKNPTDLKYYIAEKINLVEY